MPEENPEKKKHAKALPMILISFLIMIVLIGLPLLVSVVFAVGVETLDGDSGAGQATTVPLAERLATPWGLALGIVCAAALFLVDRGLKLLRTKKR